MGWSSLSQDKGSDLAPGVLWGPSACPVNLASAKALQDRLTQGACVCFYAYMCVFQRSLRHVSVQDPILKIGEHKPGVTYGWKGLGFRALA